MSGEKRGDAFKHRLPQTRVHLVTSLIRETHTGRFATCNVAEALPPPPPPPPRLQPLIRFEPCRQAFKVGCFSWRDIGVIRWRYVTVLQKHVVQWSLTEFIRPWSHNDCRRETRYYHTWYSLGSREFEQMHPNSEQCFFNQRNKNSFL